MLHQVTMTPTQRAARDVRAKLLALQPKPKPIPITSSDVPQEVPVLLEPTRLVKPYAAPRKFPKMDDVLFAVCEHYNVPDIEVLSKRRHVDIAYPRHVFCYLARELTLRSLPDIGRFLSGRDHTTILHSVRKITGLASGDEQLRADIESISARVRQLMERRNAFHFPREPVEYIGA